MNVDFRSHLSWRTAIGEEVRKQELIFAPTLSMFLLIPWRPEKNRQNGTLAFHETPAMLETDRRAHNPSKSTEGELRELFPCWREQKMYQGEIFCRLSLKSSLSAVSS